MQQINEANYNHLTRYAMFDLGFPNVFDAQIQKNMERGPDKFDVAAKKKETLPDGKEQVTVYTLKNFELSDNGLYYYNGPNRMDRSVDGEVVKSMEFSVYNQRGFNREQMEGLMRGQPVLGSYMKDGVKHEKWFFDSNKKDPETGLQILHTMPKERINAAIEIGKLPTGNMDQATKEEHMRTIQNGGIAQMWLINQKGKAEEFSVKGLIRGGLEVTNVQGVRVDLTKKNYAIKEGEGFEVIDLLEENEQKHGDLEVDDVLGEELGQDQGKGQSEVPGGELGEGDDLGQGQDDVAGEQQGYDEMSGEQMDQGQDNDQHKEQGEGQDEAPGEQQGQEQDKAEAVDFSAHIANGKGASMTAAASVLEASGKGTGKSKKQGV